MADLASEILEALTAVARNNVDPAIEITGLGRLSGGASQETWAFKTTVGDTTEELILRRSHDGGASHPAPMHITLETEAKIMALAADAGVLVPRVRYVLKPEDELGSGFIMDFIEGETIARKVLRDDAYADARPKLAYQCGQAAAKVHTIPIDKMPELDRMPAGPQLAQYKANYDSYDYPHPVFELAFRWLEDRLPDTHTHSVVHGDFRHGNVIIGTDGLRAVLDWELAHAGDPMEDLGWICVNSWRFGHIDNPVGGFGSREDLFAGYEAAGGVKVDPQRVKFWETFGSLRWGIMCMSMYNAFKNGPDPSVERATIGRRSSEAELDLMNLIAGSA